MKIETNQHTRCAVIAFLMILILLSTACGGSHSGTSTSTIDDSIVEETSPDVTVPGETLPDETVPGETAPDVPANDGTGSNADPLAVAISDATFTSTHFSGSGNCALCHNNLSDGSMLNVSIESDWSTSMMANSTRDPFWRAKVASEIQRNPQHKTLLDDKCSRCHAPMANVEASFHGSTIELFDEGFLNPENIYYNNAMDGVSCTVCHQIENSATLGTLAGFSGNYRIVDLGTSAERTAFGQYADPAVNPMLMNSGFRPTYSAHIASSELCATCHNLKTPFVDSSGTVVSTTPETEFPEQMVYSEWENSSFASGPTARSCQDCHMPKTDGVKIANRPQFLTQRDNFARHTLVGANTAMLDILSRNKDALAVTAESFDLSILRARAMLESAADIEVVSQNLLDNELTVQLRINNHSGHKLPTSFPSRRVYIHFVVRDSADNIIFESGKTNADGSIVGADADTDLNRYEPHYDEITQENQVQIYEPIMGDTDGNVTYTLLRAARYLKDNRLPPTGFDKNSVADDIRVVGVAMGDMNFNAGSDIITYKIDIGPNNASSFTAALKYQSLAYGFVSDLFQDNDNPEVAKFESMYDNATLRSETISEIHGSLPFK
ncbi:multiheme c-type cytochrome [Kaarinaea lacus]